MAFMFELTGVGRIQQLWMKELRQKRFTDTEQLVQNYLVLHANSDYTR